MAPFRRWCETWVGAAPRRNSDAGAVDTPHAGVATQSIDPVRTARTAPPRPHRGWPPAIQPQRPSPHPADRRTHGRRGQPGRDRKDPRPGHDTDGLRGANAAPPSRQITAPCGPTTARCEPANTDAAAAPDAPTTGPAPPVSRRRHPRGEAVLFPAPHPDAPRPEPPRRTATDSSSPRWATGTSAASS